MSRAQGVRRFIGILGMIATLAVFFWLGWSISGIALIFVVFVATSILAEAAFRRLADREEIIADLEDRVRNPPGD